MERTRPALGSLLKDQLSESLFTFGTNMAIKAICIYVVLPQLNQAAMKLALSLGAQLKFRDDKSIQPKGCRAGSRLGG